MRRVSTCITGLDRLIGGGFPETSSTLLLGEEGTGKSIFGLQYLYDGTTKHNEPGVLIQAEGFNQELYWYERMFGWNLRSLQERHRLVIYSFSPKDYEKFEPESIEGEVLSKLRNTLVPMGIKRAVVDSVSPLGAGMKEGEFRKSLYNLVNFFKDNGITSILISDRKAGVESHIFDNVINLRHVEMETGEYEKQLLVSKMVATNFSQAWYPVTVSDKLGFSVRPFL